MELATREARGSAVAALIGHTGLAEATDAPQV